MCTVVGHRVYISLEVSRGDSSTSTGDSSTSTESPEIPQACDTTSDPVLDELKRWEGMGLKEYSMFVSEDGLLNEFAMMWALHETFLLHYIVFKQTACHIPQEANVE